MGISFKLCEIISWFFRNVSVFFFGSLSNVIVDSGFILGLGGFFK